MFGVRPKNVPESLPWVEKYRPKTIDEVVGNTEIMSRLRAISKQGNLPNLLLCGPPGTGKTSSLVCLANELLGPKLMESAFLELNASDERGIDVIRSKIKLFAQKKVTLPPLRHKIVLLDEADSMTPAAQQALRRTMEIYSSSTRFVLSCNVSHKIIEPIQSRCAVVRFSRLTNREVQEKLLYICVQENIALEKNDDGEATEGTLTYTEPGIAALVFIAEGDLRIAINGLQSTAAGFGIVNAANVFKVCDQPSPSTIESILIDTVNGSLTAAVATMERELLSKGYAVTDILMTMSKVIQTRGDDIAARCHPNIPEAGKEGCILELLRVLAEGQMRTADGLTTKLQLVGILAQLHRECQRVDAV